MDADLQDMIKISRGVGEDSRFVQGGGGNTSVKTDGGAKMYVKASGQRLGDMREGQGYRLVDVQACADIIEDEELAEMDSVEREAVVLSRLKAACLDDLPGRPSVETSLHAVLGRCVVHTHPSVVNGLLCAVDGQKVLQDLFGEMDPPYLYIEFCGAGYSLAFRMKEALDEYEAEHGQLPQVVFLENHGLFVTADDADRALDMTRRIFEDIEQAAEEAKKAAGLPEFTPPAPETERELIADIAAAARKFYSEALDKTALLTFSNDETVTEFLRLPQAADLANVNPLSPDQAIYCKDSPVWLELDADAPVKDQVRDALSAVENGERTARCILVDGLGLFCAGPDPKQLDATSAMMRAALVGLSIAAHFGGARGLTQEAIQWLHEWEVERFRSKAIAQSQGQDVLAGKVALVTGAGEATADIALALARRGVNVVLAAPKAQETVGKMEDLPGKGWPAEVDATCEDSVANLVDCLLREPGGLDILVNCAAPVAESALLGTTLEDWEDALRSGLTSNFLLGREAAQCLARQEMGGAMVNVVAEAVLEPSEGDTLRSAIYAGEISLYRMWAMELVRHGIRVNTICATEQADSLGETVAFLAGENADGVDGQTIVVEPRLRR